MLAAPFFGKLRMVTRLMPQECIKHLQVAQTLLQQVTCQPALSITSSSMVHDHVYCCWQVCAIKYQRGVQSSLLPEVPADANRVPDAYLLQIVRKPKQRSERKPITRFKLLTPLSQVCLLFPSSCPKLQATCRQLPLFALYLLRGTHLPCCAAGVRSRRGNHFGW